MFDLKASSPPYPAPGTLPQGATAFPYKRFLLRTLLHREVHGGRCFPPRDLSGREAPVERNPVTDHPFSPTYRARPRRTRGRRSSTRASPPSRPRRSTSPSSRSSRRRAATTRTRSPRPSVRKRGNVPILTRTNNPPPSAQTLGEGEEMRGCMRVDMVDGRKARVLLLDACS
jgi:hypothetical protein